MPASIIATRSLIINDRQTAHDGIVTPTRMCQ